MTGRRSATSRALARWALVVMVSALGLVGCKPPPSHSTAPAPTTLEEARSRLRDNAQALSAEGVPLPADASEADVAAGQTPAEPDAAGSEDVDAELGVEARSPPPAAEGRHMTEKERRVRRAAPRCERVCNLAGATCELQLQICDLADRHVDDVRYEDACLRAEQQCDAAARECRICDE